MSYIYINFTKINMKYIDMRKKTKKRGFLHNSFNRMSILRKLLKPSLAYIGVMVLVLQLVLPVVVGASGPSANLDQCRNGTVSSPEDCLDVGGALGWENGNAGSSQAHYIEGESVAYRVVMENLPIATPITITLGYDIRRNSKHAIDYLTHYDRIAENVDPTDGVSGIAGSPSTLAIPAPSSAGSPIPGQPTDSFNALPAGERVMSLWNGTITGISYGSQGSLTDSQSETQIAVTFTASNSTTVLAWGGHIGSRLDWGVGNSAGDISGSPYHMRLISWTQGNLGQQDRSLSAGAVEPPPPPEEGTIVIIKDTVPNGPQDFAYTTTGGLTPSTFSLDDDTDGTLSNTQTFSNVAVGTYSVSETPVSGFDLTNTSCISSIGDTESAGSLELDNGETITCTFTNTQRGTIIIVKDTVPNDSTDFEFTSQSLSPAAFTLSDGQSENFSDLPPGTYDVSETADPDYDTFASCDDQSNPSSIQLDPGETVTCTFVNTIKQGGITVVKLTNPQSSQESFEFDPDWGSNFTLTGNGDFENFQLDPGPYSVSEINVPSGWDLTSATCVDQDQDSQSPNSITLEPDGSVTCTFVNTQRGQIIVSKVTDPEGAEASFEFETDYSSNFFLVDGEQDESELLEPGTYSVSEIIPDGWELTSAVCSDDSDPESISLEAGEIVTCTFTNTQQGKIIVEKQTDPDSSEASFEFETDYSNNFFLADGQQNDSGFLSPGTYSVSENVPAGWDLTSATCSDQSDPSEVSLQAGETVTCTFTNTQLGTIIVEKDIVPDDEEATFGFLSETLSPSEFSLGDGGTQTFENLEPGTYDVSELANEDYNTTASCSDESDPQEIILGAGETITCTFTNTLKQGGITIVKQTNPDESSQSFEFDPSWGENFTLSDGQSQGSGTLDPGVYSVSEVNIPSGWSLTSATCSDESDPSSISLGPDESITCTFTNTQNQEPPPPPPPPPSGGGGGGGSVQASRPSSPTSIPIEPPAPQVLGEQITAPLPQPEVAGVQELPRTGASAVTWFDALVGLMLIGALGLARVRREPSVEF